MTLRIALLLSVALPAFVAAQGDPADGLPERVRSVLLEKCGECHGPDVKKPKARFGFVGDLGRVAKKFVTPKDAEESELWWYLIGEQELMPPKKAKAGPLTVDEFALIRWWIMAGAPAPKGEKPSASAAETEEDEANPLIAASHVAVVHFPIALAWAALLAELLVIMGRGGFATTARFCVVTAFLGAFLAAWSGWAVGGDPEPDGMSETHRWIAVGSMAALGLATLLIPAARKGGRARVFYRLALVAGAGLVGAAGYLGGEMVHGAGHLLG